MGRIQAGTNAFMTLRIYSTSDAQVEVRTKLELLDRNQNVFMTQFVHAIYQKGSTLQ